MKQRYFSVKETVFEITEKYPETLDLFISKGFKQMSNKNSRETIGKIINLESALKSKNINIDNFVELLVETIKNHRENIDITMKNKASKKKADVNIQGLLPCPVRLPLLEALEGFLETSSINKIGNINYELKAASMGLDWLKNDIKDSDELDKLADIFISAGFDLFFEEDLMGKFKKKKVFKDYSGLKRYNSDFENENIELRDPKGDYSMIGVVPAVFLVNKEALQGREVPKTWEDILSPEFENSVSLPIGDFDLFNAILLNINKKYGREAVTKLGKSLMKSLHPSQMVKSHTKPEPPAVTIMPYFFTKTVRENGPMIFVWPEDGAIISPIFMLTKADKEEKIKKIAEFFSSKYVGEILAHKGLFPSVNPDVDNKIDKDNSYMWIGWDYIYANNIGNLLQETLSLFNKGAKGEK